MNSFYFDPTDFESMIEIMDEYCDTETMFMGENENGEFVTTSVFKDMIVTETCQSNGWVRKNVYWRDGAVEELYEEKWK